MKKTVIAFLVVSILCTFINIATISAAEDAIVFDFSKNPTYTQVATDATKGDNWNIAWDDNLSFLGKYHLTRISFAYDETDKASVFTAHTQTGVFDPYFVAAAAGTGNAADMPTAYQIDTSVYKYIKIAYKANSSTAKQSAFLWISSNVAAYDYASSLTFDIDTSNEWKELVIDLSENTVWQAAGTIKQLRVNAFRDLESNKIGDGDTMAYKYIAFFKTEAEAEAYGKPAPTDPPPTTEPTTPPETSPETGDNNNAFFFTSLIILVLSMVVILNKKRILN